MKTGGSNYIAINGDFPHNPVVGRYHEFQTTAEAELRSMYEHGQRKVTFTIYYCPLNFPAAHDHLWGHVVDSQGGTLCDQHRANLTALLSLIQAIGYNELHLRFAAQGKARVSEWTEWEPAQFSENSDFVLGTCQLVEDGKGTLKVVYDLAMEHGREAWTTNAIHRMYCMSLWRNYIAAGLDPGLSCFCTVIHGGNGMTPMLQRLHDTRAPFPGVYCFDNYSYEYATLTSAFRAMTAFGEQAKPVFMQETYYNDAHTYSEIKRALAATPGLNFAGIFQWPHVRGTPVGEGCPDGFPKRYDNYLVDV